MLPIQCRADTVIEWEDRKRDLNVQDGRDYWYGNIPQSTLQNIIDYKMIIDKCAEYYSDIDEGGQKFQSAVYQYLNKFEKESQKTINYMLKEFEMKKYDSYVRASIAKTGQLDMTRFIHTSIMKIFSERSLLCLMVRIMVWSFWSIGLDQ